MNFFGFEDNEEIFNYFDVQNLSIDHSLKSEEIDAYKDLIFSPNNINQIYFKGSCDLVTIDLIKNLLIISEYCDDSKIDKYVLLDLDKEKIDSMLDSTYDNPSTWNLPYEIKDNNFKLTDIPKFRTLKSFIEKITNKNYSPIEQIMYLYDVIKMFNYEDGSDKELLPDVISKKSTNSYGMNKLFSYILNDLGFKTFIGEKKSNEEKSYVTIVSLVDKKYSLGGIYAFDPSMDSLSKNDYSNESVRRINYNFFGIPLSNLNRLSYGERLVNILAILAIEDSEYSKEKIDNCTIKKIKKDLDTIKKSFGTSYSDIHKIIKSTRIIDIDTLVKINEEVYPKEDQKYREYLKDNYISRRKELFFFDAEEELEEFVKKENNQL